MDLTKAREYAIECHASTNHIYDNKHPYSFHLQAVVDVALSFLNLIPEADRDDVIAACWLHDVIEDCRQTYNDVKAKTNEQVADIVYAVSNEKGKSRSERANEKYYRGIRETKYAALFNSTAGPEYVNIRVQDQDGKDVFFPAIQRQY